MVVTEEGIGEDPYQEGIKGEKGRGYKGGFLRRGFSEANVTKAGNIVKPTPVAAVEQVESGYIIGHGRLPGIVVEGDKEEGKEQQQKKPSDKKYQYPQKTIFRFDILDQIPVHFLP